MQDTEDWLKSNPAARKLLKETVGKSDLQLVAKALFLKKRPRVLPWLS